ncbi:MAG: histidine--tRNA ligase [Chloroflexi bacterium]|nr:histidine--tRNA ligase [Chloroflexota bacterium]
MYRAPRGTNDILPADQSYWRMVEKVAAELSRLYGYQRIDTPVFEDASLFVRTVGEGTDIVEKETYTFEDRGNNRLTLRPEGTAPVCRAYIEHGMASLPQPIKLYYFAPIFRYDRPQAGRYREHHQFGCEALGDLDPALDAEVIGLAWELYRRLGLQEISLQLNSIGHPGCRPAYLQKLVEHYRAHVQSICADCKVRLEKNPLRLLDCKEPGCQHIANAAPTMAGYLCAECREHLEGVQSNLEALGIPFQMNHRLVRGFDYYTKTVFEFWPPQEGAQSTIGAGGRYDGLIEALGGRPTPGVGFATGIERLIINLKAQGVEAPTIGGVQVFVGYKGAEAKKAAFTLTAELREAGVAAVLSTGDRSLKAQMRHADALGARYALILGSKELAEGTVTLRDMARAEQRSVPRGEVAQELLRLLA